MKIKLLLISVILFVGLFLLIKPYYTFLTNTLKISPLKLLFTQKVSNTVNNQVNILILGIAGGTHDGPNLSDAITVVHYDFTKSAITTISIPRDIWSDTLRDKINSAYAYGESVQKGGGIKLAKAEVAAITGLPIQYGAVINFSEFKELIDFLGGVDIEVQRSFTDNEFPVEGKENDLCEGDPEYGCRYESISFKKGKQHFDGTTALKFIRSRHAEGEEGGDFARNKRQQLVMSEVKNKVVSSVKSYNIDKIQKLYAELDQLVSRDIPNQEAATLAKNVIFNKDVSQKNYQLSQDLFEVPDSTYYDGKYVLVPIENDYTPVHEYISCLTIKGDECLKRTQENLPQ